MIFSMATIRGVSWSLWATSALASASLFAFVLTYGVRLLQFIERDPKSSVFSLTRSSLVLWLSRILPTTVGYLIVAATVGLLGWLAYTQLRHANPPRDLIKNAVFSLVSGVLLSWVMAEFLIYVTVVFPNLPARGQP